MHTRLCDLLGIEHPLVQAPIGGASCPELAAAVSNAGALGLLASSWTPPDKLRDVLAATRALTGRPFGVNLLLHLDQRERLAVALEDGIRIVSLFWGDPAPYVEQVKRVGGIVLHSVGSVAEAKQAAAAGVDAIVAQGWEAGGKVRGETATSVLVPAVCDAVHPVPVVAAGGIGDGRGLAAALALGADGVWVGTRFLSTPEARTHPRHRARLLAATPEDAVHTTVFDIGWPDAPHRVLRNATFDRWVEAGRPPAPQRPGEGDILGVRADGRPIERYSDTLPVVETVGNVDQMALYAGQSVGLVRDERPAGELVREMIAEADRTLARLAGLRTAPGRP